MIPPFDVAAYARESTGLLRAGFPREDGARPPAPTVTNEAETELARQQSASMDEAECDEAQGPPHAPVASSPRLPTSILSLANSLAPSTPPPCSLATDDVSVTIEFDPEPSEPAAPAPTDPLVEMRDRLALGDYAGALATAEKIIEREPEQIEARDCADRCRAVLVKMYTSRIGSFDRTLVVMVPVHQLRWLSIDHRAGFILSLVDGISSLEMILDMSGMPQLDALRILYELVQQHIIGFRS